ncbi:hypothetical protein TNCV_4217911 [Trichonephila clavipes]|nr:hypothetical protein TNCV_4217911 [Trichonephila clavipes]
MPDVSKHPPSTHGVRTRKISGSESLVGRITSAGDWRIFPFPSVPAKIMEVEIGGVAIYRPFGKFRRANSYCHLYSAQGFGQHTHDRHISSPLPL